MCVVFKERLCFIVTTVVSNPDVYKKNGKSQKQAKPKSINFDSCLKLSHKLCCINICTTCTCFSFSHILITLSHFFSPIKELRYLFPPTLSFDKKKTVFSGSFSGKKSDSYKQWFHFMPHHTFFWHIFGSCMTTVVHNAQRFLPKTAPLLAHGIKAHEKIISNTFKGLWKMEKSKLCFESFKASSCFYFISFTTFSVERRREKFPSRSSQHPPRVFFFLMALKKYKNGKIRKENFFPSGPRESVCVCERAICESVRIIMDLFRSSLRNIEFLSFTFFCIFHRWRNAIAKNI